MCWLLSGDGWRRGEKGKLPEALQTVIQLFGPETLKDQLNWTKDDGTAADIKEYEAVLEEWKRKFTKVRDSASIVSSSDDDGHVIVM